MKNSRLLSVWLFVLSILILNAAGWWWVKQSHDSLGGEDGAPGDTHDNPVALVSTNRASTKPAQAQTNQPPQRNMLYVTSIHSKTPSFGDPDLSICFNEQPDLKDAHLQVRFSPEVKLTITPMEWRWEPGFRISGPFKPGEMYTLTFSPNLKTSKGLALGKEIQRSVLIPHREPDIAFDAPGRYLAPQGKLTLPIKSVNCTSLVSSVSRVLPQNLVYFAKNDLYSSDYRDDANNAEDLTQGVNTLTNRLANMPNTEQRSFIHLSTQIPQAQRGVFLVVLSSEQAKMKSRLVCITDIGISVRAEPQAYTLWVTSLGKGTPAPDHTVKLYGRNNALLAQGATDKDGFARLKFNEKDGDPLLMVVASPSNEDFTFLALSDKNQVEQMTKTTERYLKPKTSEAFIFTDREIYRHGETVFAQALLRTQDNTPPTPFPVILQIMKPNGKVFKTLPLMADTRGCVTAEITMPDYLPSGTYRTQLTLPGTDATILGQSRFSLESFVPPQIRVKHLELPASVNSGEKLIGKLGAEHLFGKPANGLKYETMLLYKAVPFVSTAWEDYQFGDEEKAFAVETSATQKGELDEKGQACFTNEIPKNLFPPARLDAIVQSTVTEAGGRTVTARATVPVHPYPFYIGIKNPKKNMLKSGQEQTLHIANVLPDGKQKMEPVNLNLTIEHVSWISNFRKDQRGYYQWESQRIKSVIFTNTVTCKSDDTSCAFTVPAATGDYLLTLTDPVSQSSTSWRFVSSDSDVPAVAWDRSSPDRVKLVFDKESYLPDETIHMQIRSPFSGIAWVTLQQTHILENQVIVMTNNTAEVTWTAHKAWSPNLEVAVSVIRPAIAESVWSAHRASGIETLRVSPVEHKLNVSIKADHPAVAPKTTLPIKITVTASSGQPAQHAAVTVLAVDEGICMLTDMKTPSPYTFFKRIRTAGLSFYDIFSQLMPITDDLALQSASHVGGDGEEDFAMKRLNPIASRRFKPVSLWKGNLELDANGTAIVPIDLPEFTGELRLMAIAWNMQATGSSETSIKVKRKVIVQPDLPRFLAPNDRATFQVTLHNESGAPAPVQISTTVDGPIAIEKPSQSLQLATGESRSVLFNATVKEQVGLAHVTVKTEGAGEHYEETIEMAVRPAVSWEDMSEHLVVRPNEEKEFKPAENCLASTFSQTVYASTRPSINLVGALEYVVHYPYGCLEQTTSSVFPLIPLKELANQVAFKNTSLGDEAPDLIQAAVSRILSMQRYNGFAMWPTSYDIAKYESVYASHFLVEAANAGYKVPADVVPFCVSFLEDSLRNENCSDAAYICHVLALAKHPAHGAMLRLFEKCHSLGTEDRFHLARALIRSGDISKGRGVLETVKAVDGLREAAFGLLAWCEIDPASTFAVICSAEIEKGRTKRGHWGTTQDNALALLALGRLAQHVDVSKKLDKVSLLWNGAAKQITSTNTAVWTTPQVATLKNTSEEPIFVTRLTHAVPLQHTLTNVDEGIVVRRNFITSDRILTNVTTIARGDLVWVEISLDTRQGETRDIIIEDLLPAGLEVEMGADQKAAVEEDSWILHREVRDDRLLLFAKPLKQRQTYTYAARAVTAGDFIVPAISGSAMYDPGTFSRHGATRITIK
jgi:hypothetical protein